MKRSKIVFILPSLTAGGAERVVTILANELIQYYDVKIIQLYNCAPFYKLNKNIELNYCKPVYNPEAKLLKSLPNHVFMVRKIYNILKNDADIAIGFTTTSNIYTVVASKLAKIPCIISERINPNYNVSNSFWQQLRKLVYPKASKLVLQTKSIKKYFEAFVSQDKLEIINNPIDSELTKYRDLNYKKEQIILHVGRLSDQKNQELLIKVFSNIPHKDWTLILVGDGSLKQKYQSLINKLNEQENIILFGKTHAIHEVYNRAKIFAFTSNYEGFPNALIEAMHFGLPCISTDCPTGPSELINNNENGFLIPMNDQTALETNLLNLMQDENLRKIIGENAMKSTEIFKADEIAETWRVLINDLIL